MISRRQIISGSAGPIFAIFSPNESVLGAESTRTSFSDISTDVAMATNFVKKMANSPHLSLWHSETEWDITTSMCAVTGQVMPVYRVKIS